MGRWEHYMADLPRLAETPGINWRCCPIQASAGKRRPGNPHAVTEHALSPAFWGGHSGTGI